MSFSFILRWISGRLRVAGLVSCAVVISAALIAADYTVAAEFERPGPDDDLIGQVTRIEARYEDTFVALGQAHGVGYEELVAANPTLDPWLPGAGAEIVLPSRFILPEAPREGIVLNLAEMRMYYYPTDGEPATVQTFPISVGNVNTTTPIVTTQIIDKVIDPVWYPPDSIIAEHAARGDTLPRIVPPGPDNPLGRYAMQLGIPGYLIHATNRPAGIGMRVTHGCIRMLTSDISVLFEKIPRGTPVRIINNPYKMGWYGDTLFLEVHRPFQDDSASIENGMTAIVELYVENTPETRPEVDWDLVERVFSEARGIPVPISEGLSGRVDKKLARWCSANAAPEICAADQK